ncbi:Glycerol-3-phosphate regulon repressor [Serratia fonticola]|uniref:Glycerol-3-phosphate regulon repressor n=1 Tax=Serratia fonticola TaxID=47917 RepID=A0A4U9TCE7_SERFO|nr:Glycerol-3-phosphate regulon repressor [Serratia fonticola]
MIPVERHQQILALVSERGAVSIAELTERLGVSHMTIRRDLQKLEEQGSVLSVSGGVQAAERVAIEPSHQDKEGMFSQQKAAIGQLAARQIPANSCIYLDAGTTTLALARQLGDRDDITVVTNDFVIAAYLLEHSQCKLIHTGGTVCRETVPAWGPLRLRLYVICLSIWRLSLLLHGACGVCLLRTRIRWW